MEPVSTEAALPLCDHFETEVHGPVALLRISRPGKLNALTAAFWPQLRTLLDAAVAHPAVRAIVLTGSGDRSFSAGGDIEAFAGLGSATARRDFLDSCLRAFTAIEECRLPVIAAVNGWALGGGCELALACASCWPPSTPPSGCPRRPSGWSPASGSCGPPPSSPGRLEDHERDGRQVKAGDRVYLVQQSANRDGGTFADPDRFDITRPTQPLHVGFGRGVHACLGAQLARIEARVALPEILGRLAGLRVAGEVTWRPNIASRAVSELRVGHG